jgi:molybdopterin-guanine dinucleotide biosynthesis protein A
MKNFLVIPMGGLGQRFINSGYKIYKPFLPIDCNFTIVDKIIDNFSLSKTEIIIIGNKKKIKKNCSKIFFKKIHFIEIQNHKKGPLFSIYLALSELKKIIKNNSLFICYADINWKWKYNEILNVIKNKNVVIFTHTGFHPHLELNKKSDFCISDNNRHIKSILQKKTHFSDYKKELLAIGCYYFSNFSLIEKTIKKINFFPKKILHKEFYLVSLVKNILKENVNINYKTVNGFVHLGTPEQYEDFLMWKKVFSQKFDASLGLSEYPNIMLMGGKGKRVRDLKYKKAFLPINNIEIFKYIFRKFGSKQKFIITNSEYVNALSNSDKKYKVHLIKKTNSMFSTVYNSKKFIEQYKNFFLTSCDCFGGINKKEFKILLNNQKPDLVIFGYKFTYLQKTLISSHTELILQKNKILKINVKSNSIKSKIGHAGFFWIKDKNVFKYFEEFKKYFHINIGNREPILDDYFSYLLKKKLIKICYYNLKYYVHIGSVPEYKEYNYWERFF